MSFYQRISLIGLIALLVVPAAVLAKGGDTPEFVGDYLVWVDVEMPGNAGNPQRNGPDGEGPPGWNTADQPATFGLNQAEQAHYENGIRQAQHDLLKDLPHDSYAVIDQPTHLPQITLSLTTDGIAAVQANPLVVDFGPIEEAATPTGQWTWVDGNTTTNGFGVYGTEDVPNAANGPGARYNAVTWVDSGGNLWLFGGAGYAESGSLGLLNDLWRFNHNNEMWMWVDGAKTTYQNPVYGSEDIANAANVPGAREGAVSWIDASGNLWMFGGSGRDSAGFVGILSDLWMFNTTTGNWTWVDGPTLNSQNGMYGTEDVANAANVPGGRFESVSWIDVSGNLWLFGGQGRDSAGTFGWLNDLWMFNPTTGNWTWVDGSMTQGQLGTYGTEDTAAPANVPGARYNSVSWIDSSGRLWLFSGLGLHATGGPNYLNDLWMFTPGTGQWTWVDGSTGGAQVGTYGTEDSANPANVPGARNKAVSWRDASGNLWMFGGEGYSSTVFGNLNDLWRFEPATGNWTWIDGSTVIDTAATYGTEDVPASGNDPGARNQLMSWFDLSGNLWLMGGGVDGSGNRKNDLWRFSQVLPHTLTYTSGLNRSYSCDADGIPHTCYFGVFLDNFDNGRTYTITQTIYDANVSGSGYTVNFGAPIASTRFNSVYGGATNAAVPFYIVLYQDNDLSMPGTSFTLTASPVYVELVFADRVTNECVRSYYIYDKATNRALSAVNTSLAYHGQNIYGCSGGFHSSGVYIP